MMPLFHLSIFSCICWRVGREVGFTAGLTFEERIAAVHIAVPPDTVMLNLRFTANASRGAGIECVRWRCIASLQRYAMDSERQTST